MLSAWLQCCRTQGWSQQHPNILCSWVHEQDKPDPEDGMHQAWFASECIPKRIFIGKLVVFHFSKGSEWRTPYWKYRETPKYTAGFEPMTSASWGVSSTAVLQPLPRQPSDENNIRISDFKKQFTKPNFCRNFQSTWWHRPKFLKPERFIFQKCKKKHFNGKVSGGLFDADFPTSKTLLLIKRCSSSWADMRSQTKFPI